MSGLLREPLLHFLLLGAALFVVDGWLAGTTADEEDDKRIAVTAGVIAQLRDGYERQYRRPPTTDELRGLVTAHLREEVLYREALTLGLDQDDSIVRRRLAQKMEFLTSDLTQQAAADEAALAAFFSARAAHYAKPSRLSFRHVYFSREKRAANTEADARDALAALQAGGVDDEVGDGFLHGFEFQDHTAADLTAQFGNTFATALAEVTPGTWSGPLTSSYGVHLVRVDERIAGEPVTLAEVRERVARDFAEDQRVRANQALFEELSRRYAITIDEAALAVTPAPVPAATP